MKTLQINKTYQHAGHSPLDLAFLVEAQILDDDYKMKYLFIEVWPLGTNYGITSEKIIDNPDIKEEPIYFESLKETKESKYKDEFAKMNKVLKRYVKKVYAQIDDTKYYGYRCGAKLDSNGFTYYIESTSYIKKEKKYYYIQIELNKDKYHYSVTEKSIFLRMELGDIYYLNYEDKKVPYLASGDKTDDLSSIPYMKEDADYSENLLNEYVKSVNEKIEKSTK